MRLVTLVTLGLLALFAAGCDERSDGAPDPCSNVMRLAGNDVRVVSLGDDGKATPLAVSCARVSCLRTRDDALAIVMPDGRVFGAWQGESGRVLDEGALGDEPTDGAEAWVRRKGNPVFDGERLPGLARPELSREFRTCGTTQAGGGFGWHIIRNDGDVWQRVHWGKEPVLDEVRRLPPEAYPVAMPSGELCAFGVQAKERHWKIHATKSGKVIDAEEDREHPPARCRDDGSVHVRTKQGVLRVAPDGSEVLVPAAERAAGPSAPERREARVQLHGPVTVPNPLGPLFVELDDDSARSYPLPGDKDLAGRPLPLGAVRDKLSANGDGKGRLLVAERFSLPGCRVSEAIHLLDVASGVVTPIAHGDVVFARLSYALERFYWVEAQPTLVDLMGEGYREASF